MKFQGKIKQVGKYWAVEIPSLCIHTQGKSEKDAYFMAKDAIEELVNKKGFEITVFPGSKGNFTVEANDNKIMVGFFLSRVRMAKGMTIDQVRKKLGEKSANGYYRYESGQSEPSLSKLNRILYIISPEYSLLVA